MARNQLLVDFASSCQPLLVLWYTLKYTVTGVDSSCQPLLVLWNSVLHTLTVSVTVGGVLWYVKVHKAVANHFEIHSYWAVHQV